jgi:hypothetical protein
MIKYFGARLIDYERYNKEVNDPYSKCRDLFTISGPVTLGDVLFIQDFYKSDNITACGNFYNVDVINIEVIY